MGSVEYLWWWTLVDSGAMQVVVGGLVCIDVCPASVRAKIKRVECIDNGDASTEERRK